MTRHKREIWTGPQELWVLADKQDGAIALDGSGVVRPVAEFQREWAEARAGQRAHAVKYVPASCVAEIASLRAQIAAKDATIAKARADLIDVLGKIETLSGKIEHFEAALREEREGLVAADEALTSIEGYPGTAVGNRVSAALAAIDKVLK